MSFTAQTLDLLEMIRVPRAAAFFKYATESRRRFPPSAMGLLFALLSLSAPPLAHAYEVKVAPAFVYRDGSHFGPVWAETQAQAWANLQAYWDSVGARYSNRSYTVSNLHPEPARGDYYTLNGQWARPRYDLTVCSNGNCTLNPNYGYVESYPVCPQGWGQGQQIHSSTNRTVYCAKAIPDAQPAQCADSCIGNPIYPSTGQKVQVETDYAGLPGLSFDRTYRSNKGFFASVTTSAFTDYSMPWGQTTQNCLPGYYNVPGQPGTTRAYCFPYISTTQLNYHVITADGRDLRFAGPNATITQSADVNERVIQVNGSGGIEWHVKREDDSTEVYNAAGALTQTILRNGQVFSYTYSDVSTPTNVAPRPGLLLSKSDAFGHTLSWTYNASGRMAQMQDPSGGVYQYNYDTTGNMLGVTYPDGSTKSYLYNESAYTGGTNLPQALTGITDQSGTRFATFKYDSYARGTSTEHAGGVEKYTLTYANNNPGAAATVVDPLGASRTYQFQALLSFRKDSSNSQSAASGVGTVSRSYTYDANGNLASKVEFGGNRTCYAYDLSRNLETVRVEGFASGLTCPGNLAGYTPTIGTAQRKIVTTWNASFRVPTSITEATRTTAFTYDGVGNELTRTVTDTATSASRTWTYTYDGYGRMLTEDGPRTDVSDVTVYTYYTCTTGFECGQLQSATDALGHITTYDSYNAHGQPTQITDANAVVTTLAYDLRQRLTATCVGASLPTCSGGELTAIEYWPTGLLKKVTLPGGEFTSYSYDAAHRLTGVTDSAGNTVTYSLDNMGNRTAEDVRDSSSALRLTHSRVFSSLNRLYQDINASSTGSATTTYSYDNNGSLTSANAPLGRNSSNLYDALNRLKQITDPASGVTSLAYDAYDNVVGVTDPNGNATGYAYNGFGDMTAQVSPDTGTTTNTYDATGNLATSTDARGGTVTYGYDELNRVTSAAYTLSGFPTHALVYTYDQGTHGKGQLTGAGDVNHALSWTYDAQGRVTGKGINTGGVVQSVGYGYTNGRLSALTLPSGNALTYTHDATGRVISISVGSTTILSNVTWEPFGPVKGWTWGNATTHSRDHDQDGRVTSLASSIPDGINLGYGYDAASRITSKTDSGTNPVSWTYGYDSLDRLTSALGPQTQGWTYDANGNRLSETGANPTAYAVNGASNRLDATSGVLNRSYGYDAVGNTLTDGALSLTYDARNRLATAQNGASSRGYLYDALGQLIEASGTGGTVRYVYDEAGHLIGEYDVAGALIQETVWLGDIPVATIRPGSSGGIGIFYVHADHLSTPRKLVEPSNDTTVWRWESDAFGNGVPDQDPDGNSLQVVYNLRFPGQVYDHVTGLNYNYFRNYDPTTGRYSQSDPIGLDDGANTYAYVGSDPLGNLDSDGLSRRRGVAPPPSVAAVRVPALIAQIRRVDPGFRYQTARPTGSRYNRSDIVALERALQLAMQRASQQTACFSPRAGRYEFPDMGAGGALYVGQSSNIPLRLEQHARAGRYSPGTATITSVPGGRTAREVAEHLRIQELTGGVPARQSDAVSNRVDPIGPRRHYLIPGN